MTRKNLVALVAAHSLFAASPARADAIDGDWCATASAKFMTIRGPSIVTPGGTPIQGEYGRHDFRYVVPASEPGAGHKIDMILVNERTVHLRYGDAPQAAPEVWRRCQRPVS